MKLMRYQPNLTLDPVNSFAELRSDLNRLFGFAFPEMSPVSRNFWATPCPINLYREKEQYILRAEVPGFDKKDLSLEVVDGSLILSGHHRKEEKAKGTEESGETRFTRTVPLPEEIDATGIKAEYANGVLTVTMPKRAEAKPRQIAIEVK